ncbi:hypothetical protein SacRon12I_03080 [Sulfolobus acidocaldarius Ron12/I]|nr:hypothetical protein SacRon12I_03080 [Sulfolobus acidocaldarius Ron12/I]
MELKHKKEEYAKELINLLSRFMSGKISYPVLSLRLTGIEAKVHESGFEDLVRLIHELLKAIREAERKGSNEINKLVRPYVEKLESIAKG